MPGCMAAMEEALVALARGDFYLPLRPIVRPPGANQLPRADADVPRRRAAAVRAEDGRRLPRQLRPRARSAPGHGHAVRRRDRRGARGDERDARSPRSGRPPCPGWRRARSRGEDARVLAIVGAGHQAHAAHRGDARGAAVRATSASQRARARAPSGSPPTGRSHARSSSRRGGGARRRRDLHGHAVGRSRSLERGWLKPGAHINAVGACFPHTRELDSETVARSAFFTDRRESCENEAGDYVIALARGRDRRRPHQGRARRGARRDRRPAGSRTDEITVFESLGLAVEDLASAEYLLRRAAGDRHRHEPRVLIPLAEIEARARADRRRGSADAARPPARHRRSG